MALAGSFWVGRVCENHGSWQGPEKGKMICGVSLCGPAIIAVFLLLPQILVKTMIRKRSFGNPFEGSRREERSLSAPGNLLT